MNTWFGSGGGFRGSWGEHQYSHQQKKYEHITQIKIYFKYIFFHNLAPSFT